MTYPRLDARHLASDHAAVALSSGGTVQGRIVAADLDGRVTLLTSKGRVTGRPVAPEPSPGRGWFGSLVFRG